METKGIVKSNPAESTQGHIRKSYSTFDQSLSYRLLHTPKFGYYTPTFVMDGVPTDEISLNSADHIDSLSLKAPFKDGIRLTKSSFMVPKMALLPLNWDQIYTLPSAGDDVPDVANTYLPQFQFNSFVFLSNLWKSISENIPALALTPGFVTALLRTMVVTEYLYSNGCLLNILGYKLSQRFGWVTSYNLATDTTDVMVHRYSYDKIFDAIFARIFQQINYCQVSVPNGDDPVITIRFAGLSGEAYGIENFAPCAGILDIFRENPAASVVTIDYAQNYSSNTALENLTALLTPLFSGMTEAVPSNPPTSGELIFGPLRLLIPTAQVSDATDMTQLQDQLGLNFDKLAAYQMICYHFYSNSNLDFVYSADLYRQYWRALSDLKYPGISENSHVTSFEWNGINKPFDYLSGQRVAYALYLNGSGDVESANFDSLSGAEMSVQLYSLVAFATLFGYRRSLRYGDYFTGSRPTSLAPTNNNGIPVTNSMVDVVDVTRSIQFQRLRNASMRWRNKIEEYVEGMFGKRPAPDYHNPFILSTERDIVFGDDVQNTGAEQATAENSRTANFASRGGRFTYTFKNDDSHPCIYMQLISFDVRRAYTTTIHRTFMHANRFDMFNPAFQYIGDQPVYLNELGVALASNPSSFSGAFGYKTRDAEYKESYDVASGGFVENLPGWAFLDTAINSIFGSVVSYNNPFFSTINPDFIRSYPFELDQFYLSLTGYSLGSRFHFVMITDNQVSAKRPMAIDPQILA